MSDIDYSKITLLIVDDDSFILKLLGKLLGAIGVENIITATNGQEALDVVKDSSNEIDAIICDLQMPVMGGHEFVGNLRELEDTKKSNLPVIILTGENDLANIKRAVAGGAQAYLIKPVERGTLEHWLQEVFADK